MADQLNISTTIFKHRLADLEKLVSRLNKASARIGNGGYQLTVGEQYTKSIKVMHPETGLHVYTGSYIVVDITVVGEWPKYDHWMMVAVNEHLNESDRNIIRYLPWALDIDIPERYRTTSPEVCEECGVTRKRNDTYIVYNEFREEPFRQVGSSCLRYYIGTDKVGSFVNLSVALEQLYLELSDYSDPDLYDGTGGKPTYRTREVLALTNAWIRRYGWKSNSQARKEWDAVSTSDQVFGLILDQRNNPNDEHLEASKMDFDAADVALEWAVGLGDSKLDYHIDLSIVASLEFISRRHFGLLCSILNAYKHEKDKQEEEAARGTSEHVGVIDPITGKGTRIKGMTWTVEFSAGPYESTFGHRVSISYINICRDDKDNVCIWSTSRSLQNEYGKGSVLSVDGTPKAHEVRDGVKQTKFSRCKVVEVLEQTSTSTDLFNDDEDGGLSV